MIDEGDHYYQKVTSIDSPGPSEGLKIQGGQVYLLEKFAFIFMTSVKVRQSRKQIMGLLNPECISFVFGRLEETMNQSMTEAIFLTLGGSRSSH